MMRSTAHKASGGEVGRGEAAPPAGLVSRTAREPEASEQGRNQPEQQMIFHNDCQVSCGGSRVAAAAAGGILQDSFGSGAWWVSAFAKYTTH